MFRRRIAVIAGIGALCAAAMALLDYARPATYVAAEYALRDVLAHNGRTAAANGDLVFLAIDNASVTLDAELDLADLYPSSADDPNAGRALELMCKGWPWRRDVYGMILDRLADAGAKVVVFDLLFAAEAEGDAAFREALDRHRSRAVVGSNFVSAGAVESAASIRSSHTVPAETLIPRGNSLDDRIGFSNFFTGADQIVRAAQFRVGFRRSDRHQSDSAQTDECLSLAARAVEKAGRSDLIPAGREEQPFRYTAPPRAGFRPRSVFEIFVPEYWRQNYGNGEFFRDKIVVVGAEGKWQTDELMTPLGVMPGAELHLNAINALLQQEFVRELPPLGVGLVTALAAALGGLVCVRLRHPWLRLVVLALSNAAWTAAALVLYNSASVYLPWIAPLLALNFTVLLCLAADFAFERVEKTRLRSTLEKYVSKNVVSDLIDHPESYMRALGGVIKPATILFCDLRGYSAISARTDSHALVAQLNEYLTAMVDCVFRYGGTLDKFMGDAAMAVWGNVRTDGVRQDAANAVHAALAMRQELARLNRSWLERGLPELCAGVAINQGDVLVGNIGSPQRMEFTVIGDAVNISWKLQELTKQLEGDVVVSERVAALLVEEFDLRSLGEFSLSGQPRAIKGFSVIGSVDVAAVSAVSAAAVEASA